MAFQHPVRVVPMGGLPRAYRVLSMDLSHGGIFLQMPVPFPEGTRLALSLEAGGQVLPFAEGLVAWRRTHPLPETVRPGAAVRFTQFLHPRADELVHYLVDSIAAGAPLAPKKKRAPGRRFGWLAAAAGVTLVLGAAAFALDGPRAALAALLGRAPAVPASSAVAVVAPEAVSASPAVAVVAPEAVSASPAVAVVAPVAVAEETTAVAGAREATAAPRAEPGETEAADGDALFSPEVACLDAQPSNGEDAGADASLSASLTEPGRWLVLSAPLGPILPRWPVLRRRAGAVKAPAPAIVEAPPARHPLHAVPLAGAIAIGGTRALEPAFAHRAEPAEARAAPPLARAEPEGRPRVIQLPSGAVRRVHLVRLGRGYRFDFDLARGAHVLRMLTLDDPSRLAIDLAGPAPRKTLSLPGVDGVKRVRVGRFANGTRVVLDLSNPVRIEKRAGTQVEVVPAG